MPRYDLRGLVAVALLAGCGGSSPRSSHAGSPFQPYGPARWGPGLDRTAATFKFGRVAITDITVGLAKADGRPWDGPGGSVTHGDYQALAAALGAIDPVAAVAPILARPSVAALDKPEVKLTATLLLGTGRQDSQVARGQRDSMRPMLSPEPTWQHLRQRLVGRPMQDLATSQPRAPVLDRMRTCKITGESGGQRRTA
jgi:hypothetical protein